jgi:hypothetical protein
LQLLLKTGKNYGINYFPKRIKSLHKLPNSNYLKSYSLIFVPFFGKIQFALKSESQPVSPKLTSLGGSHFAAVFSLEKYSIEFAL